MEDIMVPHVQGIFPDGRNQRTLRLLVHLDSSRVHFRKETEQFFEANDILRIPHPSYSPDSATSDFLIFRHIKIALVGQIR
jgi:hypothetical protein